MKLKDETKGIIAMVTLSVIYGAAGFTARTLQTYFGTWQQLAVQSWAAFFLLLAILRIFPDKRQHKPISLKDISNLFGRALIGRVISSYFFIQACLHAPLGNVGWISALPTSAFFGWWLFGQCISARDWILLTFGMIGVGIIVGPDVDIINISGEGELYALIATFASGLAALFGRSVVKERGAIYPTSWVLFFTSLMATAAAVFVEGGLKIPPPESLPMLGLVTVMVGLGAACSLYGFTHLRASTATTLLSLEAVWAVIIGLFVYGEIPTIHSLVGGGIVVGVAYLISAKQTMKPKDTSMSRTIEPFQELNSIAREKCNARVA